MLVGGLRWLAGTSSEQGSGPVFAGDEAIMNLAKNSAKDYSHAMNISHRRRYLYFVHYSLNGRF